MQQPPLLPEEALARVVRTSRMNGISIVVASGVFALLSAMRSDFQGALAGLLVAGAGAMEVHGGTLLEHGDRRGMRWLINSQLVCLGGILVYCAAWLKHPLIPPIPAAFQPIIAERAHQLGVSPAQVTSDLYVSCIVLLAVLSTVYQGSMAIYYARRKRPVFRALDMADMGDL
jgi:hypothetical protein